jgi:hypothetical protein
MNSLFPHWPDYPVLSSKNLRDARLYAGRADMIAALPIRRNGIVAEIGVWRADFSKVLINALKPSRFMAFDIFTGHHYKNWNGQTGQQLFDNLTHRQFYEREIAAFGDVVTIVEGSSQETLHDHTNRSFDLVYVDGDHVYEAVKADAALATKMVSDSGVLVFNDYILLDESHGPYGVVPVVNELVVNQGWVIVGFSLDFHLYCDIALQRA